MYICNIMKKYYLEILTNKYADFKGRARRKEYWFFTLYSSIVTIICIVLDNMLGTTLPFFEDLYGWFYVLAAIIHFIPQIALIVRRLHDVGYSGHFYSTSILLTFVFLIGLIWLFVLLVTDGDKEDNKWGSNPKLIE